MRDGWNTRWNGDRADGPQSSGPRRSPRAGLTVLALCIAASLAWSPARGPDESAPVDDSTDTSLAAAVTAMGAIFDPDEAMKLLRAIDPYYRMRGNDGYRKSLERIVLLLRGAGFSEGPDEGGPRDTVELRDFGPVEPAWTPFAASLEIVAPEARGLHAFSNEADEQRVFLCPNSFPTRPDGIVAPLVRFDASKPAEVFAGTVVFGREPVGLLFERAVQRGGALGVISSYLPAYNEPEAHPDMIRFASVPYDAARAGFGLHISPASAAELNRQLALGQVHVKVRIEARFADARSRTAIATIGGTLGQRRAIVLVGHLDEPGANDNGSGVAAMAAMAAGYVRAIHEGRLARPRRTIVFLFGTEFECSREWLQSTSLDVDLGLVIDMVGEDPVKTGAIALVERMPDPGAIWDRPPLDVHSEWGRSDWLRESDLQGGYLNDYVLAACALRARDTGWEYRSNPFEGGSDHESFLRRGIPAALLWHFTDRYYHTSMDRMDMVSSEQIRHMGVTALGLVHHFAHAGKARATEVLELVLAAARRRLSVEAENARAFLDVPVVAEDPTQRAAVARRERQILVAWARWYREALLALDGFDPETSPSPARTELSARIDAGLDELRKLEQELLSRL